MRSNESALICCVGDVEKHFAQRQCADYCRNITNVVGESNKEMTPWATATAYRGTKEDADGRKEVPV